MSRLQAAHVSAAGDGLKTREYVGYALGDTASNLFLQTFNVFLTYYYLDVWGVDEIERDLAARRIATAGAEPA